MLCLYIVCSSKCRSLHLDWSMQQQVLKILCEQPGECAHTLCMLVTCASVFGFYVVQARMKKMAALNSTH